MSNWYECSIENDGIIFSCLVLSKNKKQALKDALDRIWQRTNHDPTWSGDVEVTIQKANFVNGERVS